MCVWCAGKPQQFTLNFRPSRNFPLDVYFLLDVTGSFSQRFRDTVTPLATELGLSLYLLTGPSDSLTLPSSLYTSTTVLGSLSLSLFYPQSLLCLPSISSLGLVHNMSHWLVAPCREIDSISIFAAGRDAARCDGAMRHIVNLALLYSCPPTPSSLSLSIFLFFSLFIFLLYPPPSYSFVFPLTFDPLFQHSILLLTLLTVSMLQ